MSKKELKIEGKLGIPVVIDYIEKIVQGLKYGKVVIKKELDALTLEPRSPIKLILELKKKDKEEKLEIKLKWQRNLVKDEVLKISN